MLIAWARGGQLGRRGQVRGKVRRTRGPPPPRTRNATAHRRANTSGPPARRAAAGRCSAQAPRMCNTGWLLPSPPPPPPLPPPLLQGYQAILEFPVACGITVGTPVRIRGVPVGGVLSVQPSLEKVRANGFQLVGSGDVPTI